MWAFSTISSLDFVISTACGENFLSNNKQVCKKNIILWRCDFAFIQNNYYYYYLPQKNRQIVLILIPPKKPIFCRIVFSFYLRERKKDENSYYRYRGVGTVKFQVKQLKKIPDKFANLLNFLHFQPLISGEAAASPASPFPTPLYRYKINYRCF